MNKKRKNRVAIISALSIVAVVLGIIAFWPQQQQQNIDIEPLRTPEVVTLELLVTPSPTPLPMPTETPVLAEDNNTDEPTIKQTTRKESNALFTLIVGNNSVSVAYGVDDETLEKTPGWLETSAMPGEEGTYVIFGHRNRNHLKILKEVELGETIKIKSQGIEYSYIIESISILENDEQLTIPAATGKHLLISTCYPFYYSGSAPQKIVVLAKQNK